MEVINNFNLGSYEVIQRVDNGYFSASYLCYQYNKEHGTDKKPLDFISQYNTAKTMYQMRKSPYFGTFEDFFYHDSNSLWLSPGLLYPFICWLDDDLEKEFWQWFEHNNKHKINEL